jgi:hypothetical protein
MNTFDGNASKTDISMKTSYLLFFALCASLLTSCIAVDPYAGGNYSSGSSYGDSDDGYYDRSYNRPSSYGYGGGGYQSSTYGYGSGYGNRSCSVCGYNPCRCAQHSNHGHTTHRAPVVCEDDHHDNRSSSRSSSSRKDDTFIYKGSERNAPEGRHSRDWYKERGYSLKKLEKAD